MKTIKLILILFIMLFVLVACTSDKTVKKEIALPEGIPDFVQVSDFEKIDWGKKSVEFGGRNILEMKINQGLLGKK